MFTLNAIVRQQSISKDKKYRWSAVHLGSVDLFFYLFLGFFLFFLPCMQAPRVCLCPWHLSCHYPVTALIKKASLPEEGVFFKDAGDRLAQTHTRRERLSLSCLTLSPATEGAHVGSCSLEFLHLYPGRGATGEVPVLTVYSCMRRGCSLLWIRKLHKALPKYCSIT